MSEDSFKERWPDMDVAYLVFEHDEFIVCIDKDEDVDWETNDKFKGHKDEAANNKILNHMAILECLPIYDLNKKIRMSYKRMLGEAIARSLCNDYVNAAMILNEAETFIMQRNGELARSWYLSTGFFVTCPLVGIGYLTWFWRVRVQEMVGDVVFWLIVVAIAGAVGAFFSIIMRMGNESLDSSAGKWLHQLECASRIGAGMISAVIVGLAVYADIILSAVSKHGNAKAFLALAAISAGAIERWAPSIIDRIAKNDKFAAEKKKVNPDSHVCALE